MSVPKGAELAVQSYAQALFNVGRSQGTLDRLLEESRALAATLEREPRLGDFLESPQITREKKRAVADQAFKPSFHPLLVTLIHMVIDRERGAVLLPILREFEEVAERAEGIYPATVISARELGDGERQNLRGGLEKYAGCKLKIQFTVKPELIGGIVFRFRDKLIDASVKQGLNRLRRRFEAGELRAGV